MTGAFKVNVLPRSTRPTDSSRPVTSLEVPTDISLEGVQRISKTLRQLLADAFALYLKTKNFHWHMRGPHYRDYHLLLDEQGAEIFAITDDIAERARKVGGATLRSIGDVVRHQRLKDDDREFVPPQEMLAELRQDNRLFTQYLRAAHEECAQYNDVASTSLIETWIDQSERRTWFLAMTTQR